MNGSSVLVVATLQALRDFLDHVSADAGRELASIEERALAGSFSAYESYEAELGVPLVRLEIGVRAVQYELVALVEKELHTLAYGPWLSSNHKGPKTIYDLNKINSGSLSTLKSVSDLNFNEIKKLIETHYGLTLSALPTWAKIAALREVVNSFKHRQGFLRPRDVDWANGSWTQRHQPSPEDAYAQIDAADAFLKELRLEISKGKTAA
ncbi:MAG: hypothetical protein WAN65_01515 [Candidatus Sulfotelmatobacter sp.]